MAELTVTVTVATGTHYLVGGSGHVYFFNGSQPGSFTFPWVKGGTVRLDQSEATNDNHPLIFSTSNSTTLSTMQAGIISSGVTYYLDGASNQSDYTNTTTFNAATTRYIEIAPASETDFYFACWVHGIGMGGIMDMTQDTWGALSWSQGKWGEQNDSIVAPSGFSITGTLNADGVASFPEDGWGRSTWGSDDWGDFSLTVPVTGYSITGSLGTIAAWSEQGWGRDTWGDEPWGDSYDPVVAVSGFGITASLGDLAYAAAGDGWGRDSWGEFDWGDESFSVTLTGLSMTGSLGVPDVFPEQGWGRQTWGSEVWGDSNNPSFAVTGFEITASLGELPYAQSESGWGRDEWGIGNWGENTTTVILDGLEMTALQGPSGWGLAPWGEMVAWGGDLSCETTQLTIAALTGIEATLSLGTPTISRLDMIFDITGLTAMSAGLGVLNINSGADHSQGVGSLLSTMSLGTPTIEIVALPTSLLATMSLGTPTVTEAQLVDVTGIEANFYALGSLTIADMAVGISGLQATGSVGSPTVADIVLGISGFEMTGDLGSGGVAPLHYKDVDITGYTAYTDIEHTG